jgi:hypothetical protein
MHRETTFMSGSTGTRTGFILLSLVLVATSYAQSDTLWTFRYGATSGTNYQPLASFVDARSATGYVYVAGWAEQPTGEIDALLLKITADSGHFVWAKTYANMTAWGAVMDTSGNVYIAGITNGTTANGRVCIVKYLPSGDTGWTRVYGEQGLSFTRVGSIIVGDSQNIYACGRADSVVRIIKYSLSGTPGDVMSYVPSGSRSIGGGRFHVLRDGGAYLALSGNLAGSRFHHWFVVKLSSQGTVLWERAYRDSSGLDESLEWSQVDDRGNIYLTGSISGAAEYPQLSFETMKVDTLGNGVWTTTYNGPESLRDESHFLLLDHGNVYAAGWSQHVYMGMNGATALVKYDSLGNRQWARRFGSQDDSDASVGYYNEIEGNPDFFPMSADDSGNVYVTGYCLSPGPNVAAIALKYDSQGNLIWARHIGALDEAWDGAVICPDITGALYVTGRRAIDDGKVGIFVVKYSGR